MRVEYTETAVEELDSTLACIARDNPRAAADLAASISKAVSLIALHPELAPVAYDSQVRILRVAGHQYRLFYTVGPERILIRNIRSTRRQTPGHLDE